MRRRMLHGKIHRATITDADVSYQGSVTIDRTLMEAADILPHEAVWIWDVDTGARIETYAIPGLPGSGVTCVNGAAARLVSVGDRVIIANFSEMDDAEAQAHVPHVVFVDGANRLLPERAERGGQSDVRSLFG